MERLSKDIIVKLALGMDLPEILSLCMTSKRFNRFVCENNRFWVSMIKRDYPGYPYELMKGEKDYKDLYKRLKEKEGIITLKIKYHDGVPMASYTANLKANTLEQSKEIISNTFSDFIIQLSFYGNYSIEIDDLTVCSDINILPVSIGCLNDMTNVTDIVTLIIKLDVGQPYRLLDYDDYLERTALMNIPMDNF
jgi:hypothetical protein